MQFLDFQKQNTFDIDCSVFFFVFDRFADVGRRFDFTEIIEIDSSNLIAASESHGIRLLENTYTVSSG